MNRKCRICRKWFESYNWYKGRSFLCKECRCEMNAKRKMNAKQSLQRNKSVARKECIFRLHPFDKLQFQGEGVFTCTFFNPVTNECEKLNEKEEIEEEIKRLSKAYDFYSDEIDATKKHRNEIEKDLRFLQKKLSNLKIKLVKK